MPLDLMAAVGVGGPLSGKINSSYENEGIAELGGVHGDPDDGDPVEVDVLKLLSREVSISITVFNRGITLLTGDSEEMRRLHRFICVVESELSGPE